LRTFDFNQLLKFINKIVIFQMKQILMPLKMKKLIFSTMKNIHTHKA